MAVTKETLKRMIEELNLIPMSDEELEIVLPRVQSIVDNMEQLSEVDLSRNQGFPRLSSRSRSLIEGCLMTVAEQATWAEAGSSDST